MVIEKLTPTQVEIVGELVKTLEILGAPFGYFQILGSCGDTLPESEILIQLKETNQYATSASMTSTQDEGRE